MRHPYALGCLLPVFTCTLLNTPAHAQTDGFIQRQRTIEEQQRRLYDEQAPALSKISIGYGGFVTQNIWHYDDGVRTRTLSRTELRLWTNISLDEGIHQAYFRGYGGLKRWETGDAPDGDTTDWEGPYLDRAFYRLDIARALSKYGGFDGPLQELNVTVGRQWVQFGTGLALARPLDAITPSIKIADLQVTGLLALDIPNAGDIDSTRPGWKRNDRRFWGIELEYTGIPDHAFFVYYLMTVDHAKARPRDWLQSWEYNASYLGFGSEGSLLVSDLAYRWEYVHQWGNSFGIARNYGRDDINANALSAELLYTFSKVYGKPDIGIEYTFATGDKQRLLSNLSANLGQPPGTTDRSFNAFGYRNTGVAFAPAVSNIHILRGSTSWSPLPEIDLMRELRVGMDALIFTKHQPYAAVSDPTADAGRGFLGWELDWWFDWRITSDLSWTTKLGIFFPDAAFSDQSNRFFMFSGFTYSF